MAIMKACTRTRTCITNLRGIISAPSQIVLQPSAFLSIAFSSSSSNDNGCQTNRSTTCTCTSSSNGNDDATTDTTNANNISPKNTQKQPQHEFLNRPQHRHQRPQRPMVHLSSAPNVKFTGRNIGSPHPITPHPITPQRKVQVVKSNTTTTNTNNLPQYALDGGSISSSSSSNSSNNSNNSTSSASASVSVSVTINNYETIERIRRASAVAARVLQKACQIAQSPPLSLSSSSSSSPSSSSSLLLSSYRTTDEIDRIIHDTIVHDEGAYPSTLNYNHFPKSIRCSINEVICNGIPDTRALQHGDLLSIGVSVYLDGVHGSNCASIVIGVDNDGDNDGDNDDNDDNGSGCNINDGGTNCSDKGDVVVDCASSMLDLDHVTRAQQLVKATEEALCGAIGVCTPGTPLNEIGIAVQGVAEQYSFRSVKTVYGHGIGTELHMQPQIKHFRNSDDSIKLQPGMVITIEPMLVEGHHAYAIWDDGWSKCTVDGGLGAQFQHTILITENLPEILTVVD